MNFKRFKELDRYKEYLKQKAIKEKEIKKSRGRKKYNRKASFRLQANQRKLSIASELKFKELLKALEEKFIWQQPFSDESRYVCVDFYLPNQNIVFEIDGLVHRSMGDYDNKRTQYLKEVHNVKEVIRINVRDLYSKYDDVLYYVDTILI